MRYRGENALFWMQGTELGALRDNFKYVRSTEQHNRGPFLFNVDSDPTEQFNLWNDPAHRSLGETLEGLACGDVQSEWGDQIPTSYQIAFLQAACS